MDELVGLLDGVLVCCVNLKVFSDLVCMGEHGAFQLSCRQKVVGMFVAREDC